MSLLIKPRQIAKDTIIDIDNYQVNLIKNNYEKEVFNIFKEIKPTIIHIHSIDNFQILPILNIASSMMIKKIVTLYDINHLEILDNKGKTNAKKIINNSDKIYLGTIDEKENLVKKYGNNPKFIVKNTMEFSSSQKKHKKKIYIIQKIEEIKKIYDKRAEIVLYFNDFSIPDQLYISSLQKKVRIRNEILLPNETFYENLITKLKEIKSENKITVGLFLSNYRKKIEIDGIEIIQNIIPETFFKRILHEAINVDISNNTNPFLLEQIKPYLKNKSISNDVFLPKEDFIQKNRIKGLIIKTGFLCNNNCHFCLTSHEENSVLPFITIKKTLDNNSTVFNKLVISGGEPTIMKNFWSTMEEAYSQGYLLFLQTNGRMFSIEKNAKRISKYNTEITIGIHSIDSKKHDEITQVTGSHKQAIEGIKNLVKHGCRIFGKIIITKQNYTETLKIAKLMTNLGITKIFLIAVIPYSATNHNFENMVPEFDKIKPHVDETLNWLTKYQKTNKIKIGLDGIPYCFLKKEHHKFVTEKDLQYDMMFGTYPGNHKNDYNCKVARADDQKEKVEECSNCQKNTMCEGIYSNYLKNYGSKNFKSIRINI